MERPVVITENKYRFDDFTNGKVLHNKKKNHLPAMGWNSWNAFGSGNTQELTKAMADKIVELGLDKLGYKYIVLDDGCYKTERVNGQLANEQVKFADGFKSLADYIHAKGLKFGMYNDVGTNLCAGAAVGTCGHEIDDAKAYIEWGVDFIKVDNCYYPWDNATFSDPENARYTYAPNIKKISVSGNGFKGEYDVAGSGVITGKGAFIKDDYATGIGTFDGTGPDNTPVGDMSGELEFTIKVDKDGEYDLVVTYATGRKVGVGSWLEVAVGKKENAEVFYDDFLPETPDTETFIESNKITIKLKAGENSIRLMNHRRQENTLCSYAALLEGFNKADKDHDVILSICEWGKTQPQNWGYKVGDSWRILNDITFQVGADGDPGKGAWESDYTTSVMAQYNKAVIMDEFAGLSKGWNDPDMLMIGMDGMDDTMCKSHFAMWCMMNSPLMLGLDLRRMEKGDKWYQIISNEDLIALNQDALGVQAKRIYSTLDKEHSDTNYIRDNNRIDVLAKPLADGSVAVTFVNCSKSKQKESVVIDPELIVEKIGDKICNKQAFENAKRYTVKNLWTGEETIENGKSFEVSSLEACDNVTLKITPVGI